MSTVQVEIEGFDQFRRELRRALADQPKAMNEVNHAVGEQVVAWTNQKQPSGITNWAGNPISIGAYRRVLASMTASKAASRSSVRIGGARMPDTIGWETGSKGGRRKRQFPAYRGQGDGYLLQPTIREYMDDIVEMYGDKIDELMAAAFPD